MSDSSGAKVTNHIASQYKSDHGILAFTLITIKLVIFHAKVTYLPCARLPDFWCSFTAAHYADRRLAAHPSRLRGRRPRSLKSAAQGDGRSRARACGARAIAAPAAQRGGYRCRRVRQRTVPKRG